MTAIESAGLGALRELLDAAHDDRTAPEDRQQIARLRTALAWHASTLVLSDPALRRHAGRLASGLAPDDSPRDDVLRA